MTSPADEEEWPELSIPVGQQDSFCKFCGRSRYTTRNTLMSLPQAQATGCLSLKWRRERGNICSPCVNFQAHKQTPDKYRTVSATRRDVCEFVFPKRETIHANKLYVQAVGYPNLVIVKVKGFQGVCSSTVVICMSSNLSKLSFLLHQP